MACKFSFRCVIYCFYDAKSSKCCGEEEFVLDDFECVRYCLQCLDFFCSVFPHVFPSESGQAQDFFCIVCFWGSRPFCSCLFWGIHSHSLLFILLGYCLRPCVYIAVRSPSSTCAVLGFSPSEVVYASRVSLLCLLVWKPPFCFVLFRHNPFFLCVHFIGYILYPMTSSEMDLRSSCLRHYAYCPAQPAYPSLL